MGVSVLVPLGRWVQVMAAADVNGFLAPGNWPAFRMLTIGVISFGFHISHFTRRSAFYTFFVSAWLNLLWHFLHWTLAKCQNAARAGDQKSERSGRQNYLYLYVCHSQLRIFFKRVKSKLPKGYLLQIMLFKFVHSKMVI